MKSKHAVNVSALALWHPQCTVAALPRTDALRPVACGTPAGQ